MADHLPTGPGIARVNRLCQVEKIEISYRCSSYVGDLPAVAYSVVMLASCALDTVLLKCDLSLKEEEKMHTHRPVQMPRKTLLIDNKGEEIYLPQPQK